MASNGKMFVSVKGSCRDIFKVLFQHVPDDEKKPEKSQ